MKTTSVIAVLCLALLSSCVMVPVGYRGIRVYLLGNRRGVNTQQIGVGAYWVGLNQEVYKFPVFQQNVIWKDNRQTGGTDDSFTFQSKEGLNVDAEFGLSYSIKPDSVSVIYQKWHRGIDEITNVFLRNMVRDALNVTSSHMSIEEIYGSGKRHLVQHADSIVKAQVAPYGIVIDRIYYIGELHLPKIIEQSINTKLAANQLAQQRENEIREVEASAAKQIAAAKGNATSTLLQAQAQADANKLLSNSLTPALIKLKTIERWDGHYPISTGNGVVPIMKLDPDVTGQ